MHLAKSAIYFTVASGFGYGMVMILFILFYFSNIDLKISTKLVVSIVSCFLIILSLLSSTLHLDHQGRSLKAFSQWKSSWLAREGLFAILTFVPVIIFFIAWLIYDNSNILNLTILFGGLLSLLTVFCTAMIYTGIKAIPALNNSLVPSIYILNSLISGGIMFFCILFLLEKYSYFLYNFLIFLIPITLFFKILYWFSLKNYPIRSTKTDTVPETIGKSIFFHGPHEGTNYSTREMVNKNSLEFLIIQRFIAIILVYVLPLYTLWNTPKLYINKEVSEIIYILTLLFFIVGMLIERKLFFVEAKHLMILYYENKKV